MTEEPISFSTDAEWQDALNTAHATIRLSPKLRTLGLITEEQMRQAWAIQTAASERGLAPRHEPSALEREYRELLISRHIIDQAGAVIR